MAFINGIIGDKISLHNIFFCYISDELDNKCIDMLEHLVWQMKDPNAKPEETFQATCFIINCNKS